MTIAIQTTNQALKTVKEKQQPSTAESITELSVTDKYKVAEQLLSFKRVSPSPVPESGVDDSTNSDVIDTDIKQNNTEAKGKLEPKSKKDNNRSSGRLLPKHAVAILKEWILSPEHFSFPYPTDEEKKMLMEKTGINSKQIKYWFINARRRLWKQKLVEQQQQKQQQHQSPSSFIPKNENHTNMINNNAINAPNPLLGLNAGMDVPQQHQFIHPNMPSVLTITPQQQAAANAALLHQQMLLQQIAANTAASQMAANTFVNSAYQHRVHNVEDFVNAFLPKLLNGQL